MQALVAVTQCAKAIPVGAHSTGHMCPSAIVPLPCMFQPTSLPEGSPHEQQVSIRCCCRFGGITLCNQALIRDGASTTVFLTGAKTGECGLGGAGLLPARALPAGGCAVRGGRARRGVPSHLPRAPEDPRQAQPSPCLPTRLPPAIPHTPVLQGEPPRHALAALLQSSYTDMCASFFWLVNWRSCHSACCQHWHRQRCVAPIRR
jgi:hypothetical protein